MMPFLSSAGVAVKENGTLISVGTCINLIGPSVAKVGGQINIDFLNVTSADTLICYQTQDKAGIGEASASIKFQTGNILAGEPIGNVGKIQLLTGDNDGSGDGRGVVEIDCNVVEFFFQTGNGFFETSFLRGLNDIDGGPRGLGFRTNFSSAFGIRTSNTATGLGTAGDIWFHTGRPDQTPAGDIEFRTGDAVSGNTDTGNISFIIGTPTGTGTKGKIMHNQHVSSRVVWENDITANRPAGPVRAERFFDTTLGIPIWFDGANWVDATGAVV